MGLSAMHSPDAVADTPTYLRNSNGKSLTTPVAWGASNNVIFAGVGTSTPSPYQTKSDGIAILGAGIGDPVKNVGFECYITSIDLSEWKEYSASFQLSRDLGEGSAVGVGLERLMITDGGDTPKSFYAVYSKALQGSPFINEKTGKSKLTYSIGVGSGIYADQAPLDIYMGKSAHGTYVFGNIAYEVAESFNFITEWNAVNLNAGVSKTLFISKVPVGVTVGVADLTHYSGDGPRLVVAVSTGFAL